MVEGGLMDFETRHGTLSVTLEDHGLLTRAFVLRESGDFIYAIQASDHFVQTYIEKRGNDVEAGMSDYAEYLAMALNREVTKRFSEEDESFTPVEQLLEQLLNRLTWNGEGFKVGAP